MILSLLLFQLLKMQKVVVVVKNYSTGYLCKQSTCNPQPVWSRRGVRGWLGTVLAHRCWCTPAHKHVSECLFFTTTSWTVFQCARLLVIEFTVLDSTVPAKNQLPWKTAKKFQHCESTNDSENQYNSSYHQDFCYDFPCEYPSQAVATPRSTEMQFTPPRPGQRDTSPPCSHHVLWYEGKLLLAVPHKCFLQMMTVMKIYFLPPEFCSPNAAVNTGSCLQLLVC